MNSSSRIGQVLPRQLPLAGMDLAIPQLQQRVKDGLDSSSKRLLLLRLGPGVTGQTPCSDRRATLPAVVAICCRRPAGGLTAAKHSAPPPQLGLAHNTPPQGTSRYHSHYILNQLQVRAGPTESHPRCRSPSRGHDIQQIQDGYKLQYPTSREAGLPLMYRLWGSYGGVRAAPHPRTLFTYTFA